MPAKSKMSVSDEQLQSLVRWLLGENRRLRRQRRRERRRFGDTIDRLTVEKESSDEAARYYKELSEGRW
jgi:predicted nucleic acid-binding protein